MALDICLLMDSETEDAVRGIWRVLADNGVTSQLLDGSGKPHLSLAIWDDTDLAALRPRLDAFAEGMEPFHISYPTLGTFGTDSGTLYLGPVYSPALMEAHRVLYGMFEDLTGESDEHYQPLCWIPHCSLTLGVDRMDLVKAFEICLTEVELPIEGYVSELGMIEFNRESVISFQSQVLRPRTLPGETQHRN